MTEQVEEIELQDEGTEDQPTASGATGELTLSAPDGAEFELEEVKTGRGLKSLGEVPLLVWKDLSKAREYYGDEGVLDILDGTSLRVSFQNIARRYASVGKSMDEIAKAQINFRPGKRATGTSTPVSRAANAARKAAEKLGGEKADLMTKFMERVARGELTAEDEALLAKLSGE